MATRVDWGEFEYDGQNLLYAGYHRMPPDQLPAFLLTADGDDRPHSWWLAQTKLYDLRTPSPTPSIREIRELLANAIRHGRLVVPESLRDAERNADQFLRLTHLRDQFSRRHVPPPTPRTSPPPNPSARVPATPSRAPSPRPVPSPRTAQNSPPGVMSLQGMLAHPTLMSLPLAAPVPVPGPTPHPVPLFTLVPQPGGIPVPAPGPNPPPLVPAYARYAAYTTQAPTRSGISPTAATTAAPSPRVTPPKHPESMDEDERRSRSDEERSDHGPEFEIDELEDDAPNTRPGSKHGPPAPRHDAPPYLAEPQPDRPKKRSRQTRPLPSSEPRVCTTCSRTDSPEWRRGPYGPKTLCNACGLKWAKASGTGRRRAAGHNNQGPSANGHPPPIDAPPYGIRPAEGPWQKAGAEIHRVGSAGPIYPPPANHPTGSALGGVPIMNDLARNGPVPGELSGARPTPGDLAVTRPVHNDIALTRPTGPTEMSRALSAHEVGRPGGRPSVSSAVGSVPPPPKSSSSDSGPEDSRRPTSSPNVAVKSESSGDNASSGLMDLANVALEKEESYARRDPRSESLKRPRADSNFDRLSNASSGGYEGSSVRREGGTRPIDVIPIDGKW
ncbi:GATA type zinc finger [Ceratobasidium sp. AG-Ba]|nr:GATA type zinc finger [Ceratobasidium sp. AG-Ba]